MYVDSQPKRMLRGGAFLAWLHEAGVIPERTRRVVIEASHDSAVVIYAELYGTEDLIKVEPPPELKGVTVVFGREP